MPESPTSSLSAPRFGLVVFDWDGTLYDSTGIIVRCIQAAVRDVGGTVPDDRSAAYVIGMSLGQALAHAAPDVPPERYPQLNERYRHHYRKHHDDLSLFDGVLPLLNALKERGHQLAVATGKSRRGLDEALDSVELRGMFDASRTADETAGKPDPLMLHELSADLGVPPAGMLMIGDTTHDLLMARNAGCASLGVSYGAHTPEAFGALGPLHVAHSVADLSAWMTVNG
ncbi:HAD-IA family hydrolase [Xylophilus sp. GOD-11R]|uniref:HAD family hydrolase n=1 Tax=Xylophilus sp. GOD-11R TaxID=3089814 RepID=UPI00298D0BB6|nr:HAD-IA family hydrolase [Xylophilus sp. GOD-11R]WPB56016.1 HAD-IA family hydrolase [Xylophilus sp. GOD-11R]